MKQLLTLICCLFLGAGASIAQTITFDDLPTVENAAIPAGYAGFTWSSDALCNTMIHFYTFRVTRQASSVVSRQNSQSMRKAFR